MKQLKPNDTDIKFNGKTYKTPLQLCYEYGIDLRLVNARLKGGLSLNDALTLDSTQYDRTFRTSYEVTDHNGKSYKSINQLLKEYNLTRAKFRTLIKNGKSIEEITKGATKNIALTNHINETFEKQLKEDAGKSEKDKMTYNLYTLLKKPEEHRTHTKVKNNFESIFEYIHNEDDDFLVITKMADKKATEVLFPSEIKIKGGKSLKVMLPVSSTGLLEGSDVEVFDTQLLLDTTNVKSYKNMLAGCTNLKTVDLTGLHIDGKNVTNMLKDTTLKSLTITGEQLKSAQIVPILTSAKEIEKLVIKCKYFSCYEDIRWYDDRIRYNHIKKITIQIK